MSPAHASSDHHRTAGQVQYAPQPWTRPKFQLSEYSTMFEVESEDEAEQGSAGLAANLQSPFKSHTRIDARHNPHIRVCQPQGMDWRMYLWDDHSNTSLWSEQREYSFCQTGSLSAQEAFGQSHQNCIDPDASRPQKGNESLSMDDSYHFSLGLGISMDEESLLQQIHQEALSLELGAISSEPELESVTLEPLYVPQSPRPSPVANKFTPSQLEHTLGVMVKRELSPKRGHTVRTKPASAYKTPPPEQFILEPWAITDPTRCSECDEQEQFLDFRGKVFQIPVKERWLQFVANHGEPVLVETLLCGHCNTDYDNVEAYMTHLEAEGFQHENFCADTTCPFSVLGFRFKWLLRRHICKHHLKDYNSTRTRKASCESSGKRDALTRLLLQHVYVCELNGCSRAFYRLDSLLRHQKLLHPPGGKLPRKPRLKLARRDRSIFE